MTTARHLRASAHGHRTKIAATVAGLVSVFAFGAVADLSRAPSDPPGTAPSLSAMSVDRSAQTGRSTRPAKPAPVAKQLKYQYRAQENFYYCGPAATRIALSARGYLPTQDTVAGRLHTTVNGTQSVNETTRVLNQYGKTLYRSHWIKGGRATAAEAEQLRHDVVQAITTGYPVVGNIVGTATDVNGTPHAYPGGHYLTIVGYRDNGRSLKIADPAFVNGQASYWMSHTAVANWLAKRGYSA